MYKKLSTRTLLTHPRLTVMEDQIGLPSGETGDYVWFAGNRAGVGIIARRPDGTILMQQEYSYLLGNKVHQLPGGAIEVDETPELAANRELMEEVGIFANRLTLIGDYCIDHRRTDSRMYVYLGEDLEERETDVKDKYEVDLSNIWMTEAEIDDLIRSGTVEVAHLLAGWMLYKSRLLF